ncbi:MAG: polyribonucleotide nucleotidyltransferase [Firmicutes bacterium]|jgi:polyribonucleotide nucleotidyltransferase|nr:polyribonucleotide nucleotidyltransferase [Bacillota bacterium]
MAYVLDLELGGRPLRLETGKLAGQANGSVLVRYGDTVVLVTATMSDARDGIDFFPLLVDYEERMYAIGKIPGSWFRREGRPAEGAVLAARLIDRAIRPLFPEGFFNDVQVVATVMSVDHDNSPIIAAMIGASAALTISDIPFLGPIGGVQVGLVDGQFVINPTAAQMAESDLDLVVAGTREAVNMVEAGANEVDEETMLEAIMFGHEQVQQIINAIETMRRDVGRPKIEVPPYTIDEELDQWVRQAIGNQLVSAIKSADKQSREDQIDQVKDALVEAFVQAYGEEELLARRQDLARAFDALLKEKVRHMIAVEHIRPDGRALDEIRPITCEVGVLPRAHGTGIFTRGQTQVCTVCTLGLKSDEQIMDTLSEEDRKRYIHHYNFPAFSVGETRPARSPGRREIGHGALAERALLPVIPSEEDFPYTLRLVSEVLESNGSSSQASVCGSTLALMDAGVPIKRPVAGIAMGLITSEDRKHFAILTDIQGLEDHLGDMDFKVAGTSEGITALQMDIKITGVTKEILQQALEQARKGRLFILERMLETISEPRPTLSPWAPRIRTIQIPVDKIRDVIGPGGKVIRQIIDETGVAIDVEDDGRVFVASTDEKSSQRAIEWIQSITAEVEVGNVYTGKVTRILNFGAFVEILPGKEGLVHISKLAHERVGRVEDVVNVGDEVTVKVIEIDQMGRINLSIKDALESAPQTTSENRERRPAGRSQRRGGGDSSRRRS